MIGKAVVVSQEPRTVFICLVPLALQNFSDVRYEILFVLPTMIIALQNYHDKIIIIICNESAVGMIVEPQMTQNI